MDSHTNALTVEHRKPQGRGRHRCFIPGAPLPYPWRAAAFSRSARRARGPARAEQAGTSARGASEDQRARAGALRRNPRTGARPGGAYAALTCQDGRTSMRSCLAVFACTARHAAARRRCFIPGSPLFIPDAHRWVNIPSMWEPGTNARRGPVPADAPSFHDRRSRTARQKPVPGRGETGGGTPPKHCLCVWKASGSCPSPGIVMAPDAFLFSLPSRTFDEPLTMAAGAG